MLLSKHFVTTNRLGADTTFAIGNIVAQAGELWRVTRLEPIRGSRYGSIYVYGKRVTR